MEQFVLIPLTLYNEKFSLPKQKLDVPLKQEEKVPIDSSKYLRAVNAALKTKNNKNLVETILNSPRITLSNSDTIILDKRETGVDLVDFVFRLKRAKERFPDEYFTILNAIGLSSDAVVNNDAKAQDRGDWIPFEI